MIEKGEHMSYTVQIPDIINVEIQPNPVNINTNFILSVEASEKSIIIEPYFYFSDDIYAGEV